MKFSLLINFEKNQFFYIYILTLFPKIFFHGSGFGFSKTFFPWFNFCVDSNKLMSTWVQVTKT